MEDDRIWLYAAMIGIYFIAWVLKKIKDQTSGREEEEEQEQPRQTQAEVQENREHHLERQAERETQSDDPAEALRKLFETITGEVEEQEEAFLPELEYQASIPQPPPLTPPPLTPSDTKPEPASDLSPAEQEALTEIKSAKTSPSRVPKPSRLQSIRSMARGRGLQQAVVLKEILDQPRALRPY